MAGENRALVERAFEAFAKRDFEAMIELFDPEADFLAPTASLAGRKTPYRGVEGMRTYFEDVAKVWDELDVIPHEYKEVGDKILVLGRVYARGANGLLVDSPAGWVWQVREGKILSGRVYTSREQAIEAVGLSD